MNEPIESLERYYGSLESEQPRIRRCAPQAFAPAAAAVAAYLFLSWCAHAPELVPSLPVASPRLERQMAEAGLLVEPAKSSMALLGRRTI